MIPYFFFSSYDYPFVKINPITIIKLLGVSAIGTVGCLKLYKQAKEEEDPSESACYIVLGNLALIGTFIIGTAIRMNDRKSN